MESWKTLFRRKSIDLIQRDAGHSCTPGVSLKRTLKVWDLTSLGIAAIIGAGIFSTIGTAAHSGGPAVIFLFVFTAIACSFSALCYAEFASRLPISGSAYTYAYASFGELMAWIIGWDMLLEYAISNIVVAISWSEYFIHLLSQYGITVPSHFAMDFMSAFRAHSEVSALVEKGSTVQEALSQIANPAVLQAYGAWTHAPRLFDIPIVCNLPVLLITALITWITYLGIQESKRTSNFLVVLKILVIITVIFLGAFYIRPSNWIPFAPNGFSGILKGISSVFFAYIGFDAISTTAEECENPQRDLPRAMISSLILCTVLYIAIALVLTGMVNYKLLAVGDPLAFVFGPEGANLPWVSGIIAGVGVVALATVLLVYQLGQPRIWMAMSRDGLLPPLFCSIHPKYKTPWFSTLITGLAVGVPSLFMNLSEVADLTSIGTLFAFALVCAGSIKMGLENHVSDQGGTRFKIPYINSKYLFPALLILVALLHFFFFPERSSDCLNLENWHHQIPFWVFSIEMVILAFFCFKKSLSLIPVLGLATCSYLITELGVTNWIRFGVWLLVGLSIYFLYGIKHSKAHGNL